MARDELWDALKDHAKQVHSERVAKNPDRIAYAIQQFEAHGIEYQLKNEQTGHFHCWRKSDDKLFQFYAGTGEDSGFYPSQRYSQPDSDVGGVSRWPVKKTLKIA